jgi:hypothetical protein
MGSFPNRPRRPWLDRRWVWLLRAEILIGVIWIAWQLI